jgi:hypothetical protein
MDRLWNIGGQVVELVIRALISEQGTVVNLIDLSSATLIMEIESLWFELSAVFQPGTLNPEPLNLGLYKLFIFKKKPGYKEEL